MATAALLTTFFDTPERTDRAAREAQVAAIAQAALLRPLLEAIAAPAAFVNGEREILLCNAAFARLADMTHEAVVGRRFGEAVACVHAFEPPAGCGTTESCAWCGGGQALRRARMTQQVAEAPCRIRTLATEGSGAIDAEITCFLNYHGIGLQFAALGALLHRRATEAGSGHHLPTEWFTEDVHP